MSYTEQEKILNQYIENEKRAIDIFIKVQNYEKALNIIGHLAYIFYEYNQTFRDDFLENKFVKIANLLRRDITSSDNKKEVLFYDGFGLDVRGLHQIYLKALLNLKYKIIYITREKAKNKQPITMKLLKENNVEIFYIPEGKLINRYNTLMQLLKVIPPTVFLYTTPWDVVGILAFTNLKNYSTRYKINLTDHTNWLGVNSFDYLLEFREVGASISSNYRKISSPKILMQPYYPNLNAEISFKGFPFEKHDDDFIIFSGGGLYKTLDKGSTYYKLVGYCLDNSPNAKFWYAGEGDTSELIKLQSLYPNRIYYTKEREDLYQIMLNVDMYMNTYPLGGGLMLQFAAMAGLATLTFCEDDFEAGVLIDEDRLIFKSIDKYKETIKKYIQDKNFKKELDASVKNSVITPEHFDNNLAKIIIKNESDYLCTFPNIELSVSKKIYYNYFFEHIYSNVIT